MLESLIGSCDMWIALMIGVVLTITVFGYLGAPLWLWFATALGVFVLAEASLTAYFVLSALACLFLIKPIRKVLLTSPIVFLINKFKFLPVISETERIALVSGTTWIDADLFSGKPNFDKINQEPYPRLSQEEQAFIDGPVAEICAMTNDWNVWQERDLPKSVWDYLKEYKFFGMIIPKKYGGLEFSALAHSEVIAKLASRCYPLAITVMVPNSLGPAELLNHYGTDKQKDFYLPRLADGREIPCFGLTEPTAGSDAGSIISDGEIFKDKKGKLNIRLNWNKRWITLAAVSTVIGLAFKLRDPENLLGRGEDLGITCALIPSKAKGVVLGKRHDPLGVPFFNCPTQGKDVIISIEDVIGGMDGVGNGWRMLMESLAAGRGISLPATATGTAKLAYRVMSAHCNIRKQFGLPIGKFEGVEEALTRIAGFTYLMEAARRFTVGAIDKGSKPPVITAMAKYHFTELARQVINDAMDVQGGAAISRGPRNLLAHAYIGTPISITVEGANIMTRTLIHFGQGAIRCHPYAYKEIDALSRKDLKAFDDNFWKHIGHVFNNAVRMKLLNLTRGYLAFGSTFRTNGKYYRKLSWASAQFAFLADFALGFHGGNLKRMEKLSGRFGDILSWMYLASSILRRMEDEKEHKADKVLAEWALTHAFSEIQRAFEGIFKNFVSGPTMFGPLGNLVGVIFSGPVYWWTRINSFGSVASDKLGHKVAKYLLENEEGRERMTEGIHVPEDPNEALGRLEHALKLIQASTKLEAKVKAAIRQKKLPKKPVFTVIDEAVEAGVLNSTEAETLHAAEDARLDAIQVDSFELKAYVSGKISEAVKVTKKGTPKKKAAVKKKATTKNKKKATPKKR